METKAVVTALAALAQESRLSIYRLLVEQGPQGLAAGQIAERLELANATLSFHLKALSHAGLISGRQEGRFVIYSANFEAMDAVVGFLTANCCGGRPELCLPAGRETAASPSS
jgi:ArsR family transcriptional regulator